MTITEFLIATIAVVLGSFVQVVSGVGGGFIVVPVLAMIDLTLVPAPLIFASLSLSTLMALREYQHIDRLHLPATLIGMFPGAIIGGWLLTVMAYDKLGIVFGIVVLLAILITAFGPRLTLNRTTAMMTGSVSGVMGASTGIGAPPLALIYQYASGPTLRATLGALYTGASLLILAILFAFGKFRLAELQSGLQLVPGFVLGYWIANRFTPRMNPRYSRLAVLIVSAAAAVLLIARSAF
ncbi:MAG: TSUP family transporter [Gammaproteobacteria bacterium]